MEKMPFLDPSEPQVEHHALYLNPLANFCYDIHYSCQGFGGSFDSILQNTQYGGSRLKKCLFLLFFTVSQLPFLFSSLQTSKSNVFVQPRRKFDFRK